MKYKTSKVYSILEYLWEENSTKEKQVILKHNEDNEIWKKFLKYVFDTDYRYGITEIPESAYSVKQYREIDPDTINDDFFNLLDKLRNREITGNNAIDMIVDTFRGWDYETRYLFRRVIKKDIDAGIQTKTINKVYPGLIPTFQVQLASPVDMDEVDRGKGQNVEVKQSLK